MIELLRVVGIILLLLGVWLIIPDNTEAYNAQVMRVTGH